MTHKYEPVQGRHVPEKAQALNPKPSGPPRLPAEDVARVLRLQRPQALRPHRQRHQHRGAPARVQIRRVAVLVHGRRAARLAHACGPKGRGLNLLYTVKTALLA